MNAGIPPSGPTESMGPSVKRVIRRLGYLATLVCVLGAVAVAVYGDWLDAVLIGFAGLVPLTTARMITLRLRDQGWPPP